MRLASDQTRIPQIPVPVRKEMQTNRNSRFDDDLAALDMNRKG